MSPRAILFLFLIPLSAFAIPAYASECIECGKRKLSLCSKECLGVSLDKVKTCQSDCLHEYCSHKCGLEESKVKKSSELETLFAKTCEECKEQQFDRCDAECSSGTDYQRAKCKMGCATVDCIDICGGLPPPETQK
jgi:hypothetical protein